MLTYIAIRIYIHVLTNGYISTYILLPLIMYALKSGSRNGNSIGGGNGISGTDIHGIRPIEELPPQLVNLDLTLVEGYLRKCGLLAHPFDKQVRQSGDRFDMGQNADIIFIPYNYLFYRETRKNSLGQVEFANAVIIFDEAHNL